MKKSFISSLLIFILSSQLVSCGYLLYPERRGKHDAPAGKIDWAIAGLDAIGLLFFIIPGLIAFGVDFYSGAIYLPGTSGHALNWEKSKIIKIDPANLSEETIAAAIKENTGVTINFNDPRLKAYRDQLLEAQLASK